MLFSYLYNHMLNTLLTNFILLLNVHLNFTNL